MQEDRIPKIFISYSWSSEDIVINLAQRLVAHGVDVVIDKWDLKEGQDKYAFMERCVNDSDISKVLIICDKQYASKANNRTGGVGDETVIISSEIYGKMQQEKFIPIIAEKDEMGEPYVPTYIKSRIYIDLSDDDKYEEEYEKLLRNIYDKPLYAKPKLGTRPEWLDEENTNLFPIKDLVKQIKGSTNANKRNACVKKFISAYIDVLKELWTRSVTPEKAFEHFNDTKLIRDVFLDFVEAVAENDDEYATIVADIFEKLYNTLTCVKTFEPTTMSGSDEDIDIFKIHIWELFICVTTYMLHQQDYKSLNVMLTYTYFLNTSLFGGEGKPNNYTQFRHHSHLIEEKYKPTTESKMKFTMLGDMICNQREYLPIYSKKSLAEADLFLYQVRKAYDLAEDENSWRESYWFPALYVYADRANMPWTKMKSRRFCEKMIELFGVKNIEELKGKIAQCQGDRDMRYNGSYDSAPAILNYIKIEDVGMLN